MAPTIKHGGHLINLALPNATGVVTNAVVEFPYHAAAWYTASDLDPTQEAVVAGSAVVGAGTFANWTTLQITHYSSAGAVVDRVSLVGSGLVTNRTADLTTLAASTGNTLAQGWKLNPGDSVELLGTSSAAAPGASVTLVVGVPS